MLVVEHNEIFYDWSQGGEVTPLDYAGDVVVAIDPSKTNLAMVVGDPTGQILSTIEFSGNNRKKGPVMDTTAYCHELRLFLKDYLSKVSIYMVGVEAAITKHGTQYHHSDTVLKEIRGELLGFFMDTFNIRAIEVNNWSWKSHVLPQGYRSQSEKGSKRYYQTYFPNSPYSYYFEADMTDCLCIYKYLVDTQCCGYRIMCNRIERCNIAYSYTYVPTSYEGLACFPEYTFNPNYTIDENVGFYINRSMKPFTIKVPIDVTTLDSIYAGSRFFELSNLQDKEVFLVARRLA